MNEHCCGVDGHTKYPVRCPNYNVNAVCASCGRTRGHHVTNQSTGLIHCTYGPAGSVFKSKNVPPPIYLPDSGDDGAFENVD